MAKPLRHAAMFGDAAHVVPEGDHFEHARSAGCPCRPRAEVVTARYRHHLVQPHPTPDVLPVEWSAPAPDAEPAEADPERIRFVVLPCEDGFEIWDSEAGEIAPVRFIGPAAGPAARACCAMWNELHAAQG